MFNIQYDNQSDISVLILCFSFASSYSFRFKIWPPLSKVKLQVKPHIWIVLHSVPLHSLAVFHVIRLSGINKTAATILVLRSFYTTTAWSIKSGYQVVITSYSQYYLQYNACFLIGSYVNKDNLHSSLLSVLTITEFILICRLYGSNFIFENNCCTNGGNGSQILGNKTGTTCQITIIHNTHWHSQCC